MINPVNEALTREIEESFTFEGKFESTKKLRKTGEWNLRKKAALELWEHVERDYRERVAGTSESDFMFPERAWAVLSSLNRRSINSIVSSKPENIYDAVSLWIADRIYEAGAMEKCVELILRLDAEKVAEENFELEDSVHISRIKNGIAYILKHRNDDCAGDRKDRDENLVDRLTMSGKHKQNVPSRKLFEELIALIPAKVLEEAEHAYVKELKEVSLELLDSSGERLVEIGDVTREGQERIDYLDSLEDAIPTSYRNITKCKDKKKAIALINTSLEKSRLALVPSTFTTPTVFDRVRNVLATYSGKFEDILNELRWFVTTYGVRQNGYAGDEADGFDEIPLFTAQGHRCRDPYMTQFMALYLTDRGNILPYSSEGVILQLASSLQLPWVYGTYSSEKADGFLKPATGNSITKDMLTGIYDGQMENDYLNSYIVEEEDGEEYESKSYANLAQMICFLSGRIPPRDNKILEESSEAIKTIEYDPKDVNDVMRALSIAGVLKQRNSVMEETQMFEEAAVKEKHVIPEKNAALASKISEQNDMISRQKRQIDDFKRNAHASERQLANVTKERDELAKAAEKSRRELAEIREAMFNMVADFEANHSQEEEAPQGIKLPYKVKRKTLVFGGNDAYVKRIKEHLTGNIRFFPHTTLPNETAIKNSEVVWIQVWSISHSDYYKIISSAENHPEIEVHILPTHGIVNSAANIAKADADAERN